MQKEIAVFGFSRSGTTVFSQFLNSHPMIFLANEVFHPDASGLDDYSSFSEKFKISERAAGRRAAEELCYDRYIEMLRREMGRDIIGVNVKYASCHHLDGDWRALSGGPKIFEVFKDRGVKIFNIIRKSSARCALSNILAQQTGIWHISNDGKISNRKALADIQYLIFVIKQHALEVAKFQELTYNYPSIMEISYENMLNYNEFKQDIVESVANYLDITPIFNCVPRLQRVMPQRIDLAFENWREIISALRESGSLDPDDQFFNVI